MKKGIILTLIAVFILAMGAMVYADSKAEVPSWFNDMIAWKKEQIKKAVEDKVITEEQAKYWQERLDYMQKFHEENGFNFPGGCFGSGFGRARGAKGFGFGRGMMGRYWQTPSIQGN
ncbi:Protein of unknown function [Caminicella sporogenes DSM 14501]|uniref:DUF2680 domain-containing protein n=1 Tax=Caminicella sporogenes DSM 14501 TaxID=1121266 RepID=A0A1M6P3C6_9FIRM|nr:DUF2680 domain-containing protein [Caminicella sporogenes]RKD21545.1 hypothetical protein BET04_07405 [Caminicella sporogenes]SHK02420.1 Protein of unknown function [Caminicella sporogenes DSM 14501]